MLLLTGNGALAEPECRALPPPQDKPYIGPIALKVEATDLAHRIFHVHETLPVTPGHELTLLYPEWLPGTHTAQGRNHINKLAGLAIKAGGAALPWTRDECDVFAFRVPVPAGAQSLDIDFDYLTSDPTQNGPGAHREVTDDIMTLDWGSLVLYPAGYYVSRIDVNPSLALPDGWEYATALDWQSGNAGALAFKRTSLEILVDSPLFAGRFVARFDLDPGGAAPVGLDVFADKQSQLHTKDLDTYIAYHRALVQQAYKLFGSRHYDHYDFLVTVSDNIPEGGLEHHRSSEDTTSAEYFTDWTKTLAGRDLLPHEYTHSWNGKFRRPRDLWTANYNRPMGDSLLWVYEGQTQYWGKVLATRSGLWSKEDALDALANIAAYYQAQAGRNWRNLQDTTLDEIIAPRFLPQSWGSWRRGEDYYNEGVLLWLDVDTLIRELSNGQRSLDDFARSFFGIGDGAMTPNLYAFDDVVRALNAVQPYDWAKFLHDRLDSLGRDPLGGITRGGYRLAFTDTPGKFYESAEKMSEAPLLWYSLGMTLNRTGTIRAVRWNGPAFAAGLSGGMQIEAVNGFAYNTDRFKDAIKASPSSSTPIELIVKDQDRFRVVPLDYHEGMRYPHLERIEGTPARLDDILAAK